MENSRGKLLHPKLILTGIIWISFLISAASTAKRVGNCNFETKILDKQGTLTHIFRAGYQWCIRCLNPYFSQSTEMWWTTLDGATETSDWNKFFDEKKRKDSGVTEEGGGWYCMEHDRGAQLDMEHQYGKVGCNCDSPTEKPENLAELKGADLPVLEFDIMKDHCGGELTNGVCLRKNYHLKEESDFIKACEIATESSLKGYHICGDNGEKEKLECLFHVKRFHGREGYRPVVATNRDCELFKNTGPPYLSSFVTVLPESQSAMVPCFDDKPPRQCSVGGVMKTSDAISDTCTGKLASVSVSLTDESEISCEYEGDHKWWGFVASASMRTECITGTGHTLCHYPDWTSRTTPVKKDPGFGLACEESLTVFSPVEQELVFKSPPMMELCEKPPTVGPSVGDTKLVEKDESELEKAFRDYTWAFILGGVVLGLLILIGACLVFFFVGRANAKKGQTDGFAGWTYKRGARLQRKAQTKMGKKNLKEEPSYLKTTYNFPASEMDDGDKSKVLSKTTYEEEFKALKAERDELDSKGSGRQSLKSWNTKRDRSVQF